MMSALLLDTLITIPASWVSVTSIAALLAVGVAWGSLRQRVGSLEQSVEQRATKEELQAMDARLTEMHRDIREIRKAIMREGQ